MYCLVIIAWLAVGMRSSAGERPNVLLQRADDQRRDTIRALGNEQIRTPHLDRLVRPTLGWKSQSAQRAN